MSIRFLLATAVIAVCCLLIFTLFVKPSKQIAPPISTTEDTLSVPYPSDATSVTGLKSDIAINVVPKNGSDLIGKVYTANAPVAAVTTSVPEQQTEKTIWVGDDLVAKKEAVSETYADRPITNDAYDNESEHLQSFLSNEKLKDYVLTGTECRDDQCKLSVAVTDQQHADTLVETFTREVMLKGEAMKVNIERDIDAGEVTFYLGEFEESE